MSRSEPTLIDLFRALFVARYYVIGGLLFGMLASIVLWVILVPQYEARMIIGPAQPFVLHGVGAGTPVQAVSSISSYSADGVVEQDRQHQNFVRFEQILREASVARTLWQDSEFMRGLSSSSKIKVMGNRFLSTADLVQFLRREVVIEPIGSSENRRVIFRASDPDLSALLLTRLFTAADNAIRQDSQTYTDARVRYLQAELQKAIHPDHRHMLTEMLLAQEQVRMMLSIDPPFAATIIEPAQATTRPVFPRMPVVVLMCLFVGGFSGFILGFIRCGLKRNFE